jgi:hypothetical protein
VEPVRAHHFSRSGAFPRPFLRARRNKPQVEGRSPYREVLEWDSGPGKVGF